METDGLADMPLCLDQEALKRRYATETEVYGVAARAQRYLISRLGWLYWFTSVCNTWEKSLEPYNIDYVKKLNLHERPKRGFLLKLSRDWKMINVEFWIRHDVSVHIVWTEDEEKADKFFRYHPSFLQEYADAVRGTDAPFVRLEDMPSSVAATRKVESRLGKMTPFQI